MTTIDQAGTFRLGSRPVKRLGYGAMQLAGPACSGRPGTARLPLPCCARRSPRVWIIILLMHGASSVAYRRENLAATSLVIPQEEMAALDRIVAG